MPKSIQAILDHADEFAQGFEANEPSPNDERPVAEYLLQRAALARARSERQVVEAVEPARAHGISWSRIGTLGTSAQATRQRYGVITEQSLSSHIAARSGGRRDGPARPDRHH